MGGTMFVSDRSIKLGSLRRLFLAGLAPIVVGCAIHPLPDDVTRETTSSIVEKVRCEAKRAVLDHGAGLGNATIGYEFDFNITEHNDASGAFTLTNPFKTGTFALTGSAGADRTREASRNFRILDSFAELRRIDCRPEALEKNWLYPIAGDIGMYEAIATFAKLQTIENPAAGEVFTFGDTLNFTTTLHGNVTAKLTLSPVSDRLRLTSADANLQNSRKDLHKVIIAMKAGPRIVERGGARVRSSAISRALAPPARVIVGSGLLSTTIAQQSATDASAVLYELDRQRILELQRRGVFVVGP